MSVANSSSSGTPNKRKQTVQKEQEPAVVVPSLETFSSLVARRTKEMNDQVYQLDYVLNSVGIDIPLDENNIEETSTLNFPFPTLKHVTMM